MKLPRRSLLKLGAAVPLGLAVWSPGVNAGSLAYLEVRDVFDQPAFAPGDHVVADTAQTGFAGEGLYLYPDWGTPRVYQVREASAGRLVFSRPGCGSVLWTQTGAPRFAGRAVGLVKAGERGRLRLLHGACAALQVPELPAAQV